MMPELARNGQHLWLSHDLVAQCLGDVSSVFLSYNAGSRQLWIGPGDPEHLMSKLGTSRQYVLKWRNAQGDRSIAIHDLLLDYELPEKKEACPYTWDNKFRILKVLFT
jgi:hypothetical protein